MRQSSFLSYNVINLETEVYKFLSWIELFLIHPPWINIISLCNIEDKNSYQGLSSAIRWSFKWLCTQRKAIIFKDSMYAANYVERQKFYLHDTNNKVVKIIRSGASYTNLRDNFCHKLASTRAATAILHWRSMICFQFHLRAQETELHVSSFLECPKKSQKENSSLNY